MSRVYKVILKFKCFFGNNKAQDYIYEFIFHISEKYLNPTECVGWIWFNSQSIKKIYQVKLFLMVQALKFNEGLGQLKLLNS